MPRPRRTFPGRSWLHAPRTHVFQRDIHHVQRCVHGAWLPALVLGFTRAILLRVLPAFPPKAALADAPSATEWQVGVAVIGWMQQQLDAAGRTTQQVVVLADGACATVALWRDLPARITLIVRTAHIAACVCCRHQRRVVVDRVGMATVLHCPGSGSPGRSCSVGNGCWCMGGGSRCAIRCTGRIYAKERPTVRPRFLVVVRGCALAARNVASEPGTTCTSLLSGSMRWQQRRAGRCRYQ